MNAAAGGKGVFFKESCAQNPVLAMKNSILPVVAAPDSGNTFSVWNKVSGDGDFVDENLADTYYIPKANSVLKPVSADSNARPLASSISL